MNKSHLSNKDGMRRLGLLIAAFVAAMLSPFRHAHAEVVPKTIHSIQHETKYMVYPIKTTDLKYGEFYVDGVQFTRDDIREAIPPLNKEDVNKNGYMCQFLCINSNGKIVGWNPVYKTDKKK